MYLLIGIIIGYFIGHWVCFRCERWIGYSEGFKEGFEDWENGHPGLNEKEKTNNEPS